MFKFKLPKVLTLLLFMTFGVVISASLEGRHQHVFFDLHGVIYKKSTASVIKVVAKKLFWKYPKKWSLWKVILKAGLNPIALRKNIKRACRNSEVKDTNFDELCRKYKKLRKHRQLFLDIMKEILHAVYETVVALRAIKNSPNVTCYLLSNIGKESLKELQKRDPKIWEAFRDKDGGDSKIVCGDQTFGKDTKNRDYCKPRREIFIKTRNKFNNDLDGGAIWFVDDTKKNIKMAERGGFRTIRFKSGEEFLLKMRLNGILTHEEIEQAKKEIDEEGVFTTA